MDGDSFGTQRDVGSAVVMELSVAEFAYAEEVGRGGFGVVYRCTQIALDRVVAVKVLTARLDEKRERFLREQRAMGRLTGHPNIVGVLQVGETQGGYPYLVMQYHKQGSLEARIRRSGPLPVDEVVRLGVKMAGALDTAHQRGILHRDVKPGNILLTGYGEPALGDFGIAHISGGFKTAAGIFTGSPAFTAPEVLSGDPPSEASDVYGLGATLFAALTGHAAYRIEADLRFHRTMCQQTGNETLLHSWTSLEGSIRMSIMFAGVDRAIKNMDARRHYDIVDAIETGDADLAAATVLDHMACAAAVLVAGAP